VSGTIKRAGVHVATVVASTNDPDLGGSYPVGTIWAKHAP
jgi:hypothetical protein